MMRVAGELEVIILLLFRHKGEVSLFHSVIPCPGSPLPGTGKTIFKHNAKLSIASMLICSSFCSYRSLTGYYLEKRGPSKAWLAIEKTWDHHTHHGDSIDQC